MADYGLQSYDGLIREINRRAAELAVEAASESPCVAGEGACPMAGSISWANRTASMSPEVDDPAVSECSYDELFDAYSRQVAGLIEGGADLLLFGAVFDTLSLTTES